MKTITLVAWRRPYYLEKVLESLRKNDTNGYCLIGVLDGGFDPECYALLQGVDFMPKAVFVNEHNLGINFANSVAYLKALEFGTDLNVAVEEDTVMSPDGLDMVNLWAGLDIPVSFLNFHSPSRGEHPKNTITQDTQFNALTWAASGLLLRWVLDEWMKHGIEWDHSIEAWRQKGPRGSLPSPIKCYHPEISRVKHIGEIGVHSNPENFEPFKHVAVSDGSVHVDTFIQ